MDVLKKLHAYGAHFVKIHPKGHPVGKDWINNPLPIDAVLDHIEKGYQVGIIPQSVGCVVIDVDSGPYQTMTQIFGEPILGYKSKSKGAHLWYRAEGDQQDGLSGWVNECKYDLLYNSRVSTLYDLSNVFNLLSVDSYLPIDTQFLFDDTGQLTKAWKYDSGIRNNYLLKRARNARDSSELNLLKLTAIAAGEEARHVTATIESAMKFVRKRIQEQANASINLFDEYEDESATDAKELIKDLYTQGGMSRLDFDIIFKILKLEVRYVPRLNRIEYRRLDSEIWKALDDIAEMRIKAMIRALIPRKVVTNSGKEHIGKFGAFGKEYDEDFMLYLSKRECDPLAEYFNNLEWDGEERLANWFSNNMGAPHDYFSKRGACMLFCSIVRRTFDPGCAADTSIILYGDQGAGKTKVVGAMFPPELSRYSKLNLDLSKRSDETVYSIMGKAIALVDEMADKRGWKLSKIKALLSAQDDDVRLKYTAREADIVRYAIFIFTSDEDRPLPDDPAGNRRYIPIKIYPSDPDPVAKMAEDRDQLWAEAVEMVKAGYRLQLTRQEITELNQYSHSKIDRDTSVMDAVTSMLSDGASALWTKKYVYEGMIGFKREDIVYILQRHYMGGKVMTDQQFKHQMRALGWERRHVRVNGKRMRLWMTNLALDDQPNLFEALDI